MIRAVVALFAALFEFLKGRQEASSREADRTAGANAATVAVQSEVIREVQVAAEARETVRADFAADGVRVPEDGFARD